MIPSRTLWNDVHNGDIKAYEEIFSYYFSRYCNYGRKFCENTGLVEDAAQEAMLAVWDKRDKIPSIHNVPAYFFTSFRFILFDKIKEEERRSQVPSLSEEPTFSVDHFIILQELSEEKQTKLRMALTKLTDRQREAVFLKFYENFSYEDVAQIMGISTKASYKIMARALTTLKESFGLTSSVLFLFRQFLS